MCSQCGHYRGRLVIDVALKVQKKAEKQKTKRREMGEEREEKEKEDKTRPLAPEELSKQQ